MSIVRFSIGGGAILLSMVGLLACLAGIVGVWILRGKVEAVGTALFSAADESLVFVHAKVAQVQQALQNSRQRVHGIAQVAERLQEARADSQKELEPLLQVLEEVHQQVQAAGSWLDSCRAVAQGVSRVSEAVVSSEYAAEHAESTGVALAQRVQEASATVVEVLARLQTLRQELLALREKGQLVRVVATSIIARVADLDGGLANVAARIETLGAMAAGARASIGEVQRRLHWRALVAAAAISVLLAWFGLGQISVLGRGWQVIQDERTSSASTALP